MIKKFVLIIFFLFITYGVSTQNKKVIDSLKLQLEQTKEVDQQFHLNIRLFEYEQRSDLKKAKAYLDKAVSLAKTLNSDSLSTVANKHLSAYFVFSHQYDSVYHYGAKALASKNYLTSKALIDLYSIQGTSHYYQSDYSKSVESHIRAKVVADSVGDDMGKAKVYNNIAISYLKIENWTEAEKYLNLSIELCRKLDVKRGLAYNLGNLGIVYKNTEQYKKAIVVFEEAVSITLELDDKYAVARNIANIGTLYEQLNDLDLALRYYEESYDLAKTLNDQSILAISTHNIGSVYAKKNDFKRSFQKYNASLEIAKVLNEKSLIRDNYLGLSESSEQLNQFRSSIDYRKLYEKYNDSIINENHLKDISELNIKYESEKKEKEILALSSDRINNEAQLLKQESRIRLLTIVLLAGFFLFSTVLIVARNRSNNKKQKDIIYAISETQLKERKRIAQDLHDSVGGLLAIAKSSLENLDYNNKTLNDDIEKSISLLSSSSDQVRKISHNLMPSELIKFGLVSAIESYMDNINSPDLTAQFYPHNMEVELDETIQLNLYRIFQEVVQNVLKHSESNTVNVYLNNHGKHIDLMVEDNGIGFEKDCNSSDGMGLKSIEYRTRLMDGNMTIDSYQGKGTTINIKIPI